MQLYEIKNPNLSRRYMSCPEENNIIQIHCQIKVK